MCAVLSLVCIWLGAVDFSNVINVPVIRFMIIASI